MNNIEIHSQDPANLSQPFSTPFFASNQVVESSNIYATLERNLVPDWERLREMVNAAPGNLTITINSYNVGTETALADIVAGTVTNATLVISDVRRPGVEGGSNDILYAEGGQIVVGGAGTITIQGANSNIELRRMNPETNPGRHFAVQAGAILSINNITLHGNRTIDDPASIGFSGGVTVSGVFEMHTGAVIRNNAAQLGGGVAIFDGQFSATAGSITNNIAEQFGGGIYASGSNIVITNSTINGNRTSYDGGGLSAVDSNLTITNSIISNNEAGRDGGGIWVNSSELTITDNTIVSANQAVEHGGGIALLWGNEATITNSEISGNVSHRSGGIMVQDSDLIVIASEINNNIALSGFGGGILVNWQSNAIITDSTISDNGAMYGGGIFVSASELTVSNSIVNNNRAYTGNGGGIYVQSGTAAISTSEISDNEAARYGGGIYLMSSSNLTINDSTISSNRAADGGGIALLWSSEATIINSETSHR